MLIINSYSVVYILTSIQLKLIYTSAFFTFHTFFIYQMNVISHMSFIQALSKMYLALDRIENVCVPLGIMYSVSLP